MPPQTESTTDGQRKQQLGRPQTYMNDSTVAHRVPEFDSATATTYPIEFDSGASLSPR